MNGTKENLPSFGFVFLTKSSSFFSLFFPSSFWSIRTYFVMGTFFFVLHSQFLLVKIKNNSTIYCNISGKEQSIRKHKKDERQKDKICFSSENSSNPRVEHSKPFQFLLIPSNTFQILLPKHSSPRSKKSEL